MRQTFEFADGSAQLAPQARETLDEFGAAVNSAELANSGFRIEGHINTVGACNKALSKRRADAAGHYLTQRLGVRPARLEALGTGKAGLLEQRPLRTPDARNARAS